MSEPDIPTSSRQHTARKALTTLAGRLGEKALARSGKQKSGGAPQAAQTLAALAIARIGTRSLGGAALVSAGLIAKALFDRSQKRRARDTQDDA